MNKQLREFERESGLEIYGLGAKRPQWEAALEKYAELIVEKCLEFIEKDAANAPDSGEAQVALLACALDILDHFDID
jgi:hypothetical protein